MSIASRPSARRPQGMAGVLRLCAALLLIAAFALGTLEAQTSAAKKLPGSSKPAPAIMIDQLAQQSDVVAVGRVDHMVSEWNADRSRIQTRVTLAVEQTIKGETPDASMTVIIPGGEVDGVGELYTHMVTFQQNEDVLLFASKDTKGNLRVTSGTDGKYLIQKDAKTGFRHIPNLGSVDELSARIKSNIKAQQTGSKSN